MDNIITITNKIEEIPNLDFKGYVWLDNSSEPILDKHPANIDMKDSFIVEAYLYAKNENISVSIKHLDGTDYISIFDLNKVDPSDYDSQYYIANDQISNINQDYKYLKYIRYWKSETDSNCANMSVKNLKWHAFAGFSMENNNEKTTK
ncbi:MAG: TIGR04423 family type III CRISPR-associated protein [Candidatus Cloacimonadales bacterium]|jgi:CRISPR type III-associated protein (TIGR04423 family)|nr:TIGR04423 family type III CRISPR-associated protein [Candidatus Cloacimonadota bacterium]MDX9978144.1 TIGR04423 family type III CRISPR-associated protein [Candidatus Cloacimonadales bacterium]